MIIHLSSLIFGIIFYSKIETKTKWITVLYVWSISLKFESKFKFNIHYTKHTTDVEYKLFI